MKLGLSILMCCFFIGAKAQQRKSPGFMGKPSAYKTIVFNDVRPKHQRYISPRLTQTTPSFSDRKSSNYWATSVTTQSYGEGKWGTLYYWDIQGNLRETKGFIDIAGKNKRGLKLVFPWR